MSDSRKNVRVRTMLGGQIIFNNRSSTIDCQIRNISSVGAKITIDGTMTIPQEFEFYVPHKNRSYKARVVWRNGEETGVEFMTQDVAGVAVPAGSDVPDRMRELEAENARLRRLVADLQAQLDRNMQTV